MKSRIGHFSLVLDFIDKEFDSNYINDVLKNEVDEILKEIKIKDLDDWELQFRASYSNGKSLLIAKNKYGNFSKDKIKEITISIPIPTKEIIAWGVNKEQHIYDENHMDNLLKNFSSLEINYAEFKSMKDYILICMRRSIKHCFEVGFTVNGVKIKFPIGR